MKRSRTVIMDITERCNLKCVMCYFSAIDRLKFQPYDTSLSENGNMPVEVFEKIAADLFPSARRASLACAAECSHPPDDGMCSDADSCTQDRCDPLLGCSNRAGYCEKTIAIGGNATGMFTAALDVLGRPHTDVGSTWPATDAAEVLIASWNEGGAAPPDYATFASLGGHVLLVGASGEADYQAMLGSLFGVQAVVQAHESDDCMPDFQRSAERIPSKYLPESFEFPQAFFSNHVTHILPADMVAENVTLLGHTCHNAPYNHVMAMRTWGVGGGSVTALLFSLDDTFIDDGGITQRRFVEPLLRGFLEQANGTMITNGDAYGHTGACEGWNGCGDAATCAEWACKAGGYTGLVGFGATGPCEDFSFCQYFSNGDYNMLTPLDVGGCAFLGVSDISCY